MKKKILIVCAVLLALAALTVLAAKRMLEIAVETAVQEYVAEQTAPTSASKEPPAEVPERTDPTGAPEVYTFTPEEQKLLLQIGMAERGDTGCAECVALVMRTVLNRVEGPKFSSTIRGVIYAEGQFTPVAEGTFAAAVPNEACYEALEMVTRGWDESQGALYYEWCEGESWHSKNLNLLFQHCDMRMYN